MIFKHSLQVTHKKTGDSYQVIGLATCATNANDGKFDIIYQKVTPAGSILYTREMREFLEKFEAVGERSLDYLISISLEKNSIFGHLELEPIPDNELERLPVGKLMYIDFDYDSPTCIPEEVEETEMENPCTYCGSQRCYTDDCKALINYYEYLNKKNNNNEEG